MSKPPAGVQDFQKYAQQGAYHWTTLKPSFKTSFNPYLHARYSIALEQVDQHQVKDKRSGVAVDLGCGDAYIVNQLAKRGYKVHGVDGSSDAIALGKNLSKDFLDQIFLEVGDVCHTSLGDNIADLVISLDVIEHLQDPDAMLREVKRIAKNGATVLIGTPIRFTETPLDKYHVTEFFGEEFAALLGKYFTILNIQKSHPIEYIALMGRKFSFFGKQKNIGWNIINLYYLLTGKNLLSANNHQYPTYQFVACRVTK